MCKHPFEVSYVKISNNGQDSCLIGSSALRRHELSRSWWAWAVHYCADDGCLCAACRAEAHSGKQLDYPSSFSALLVTRSRFVVVM